MRNHDSVDKADRDEKGADGLPSFPPSIVISLGRRMTKERQGNQNGRLFGRSAETDGDISEIPARLPVNNSSRQGLPDASDGRPTTVYDVVDGHGIVNSN